MINTTKRLNAATLVAGVAAAILYGPSLDAGPRVTPDARHADGNGSDYPIRPVPFNEVEITSDFWRPRLITQRETLVPFAFERTKPGVEHLRAARDHLAGAPTPDHRPHRFIDSDLYKVMEGAAYLLQLRRDPELEASLDELVDLIAEAQHADGYLYPSHTTGVGTSRQMMGDAPYEFVVHSHELYNVGHMYEAAIAYYRATGKGKFLGVAKKSADHVYRVFFEGDPEYNGGQPVLQAPGHQEIELALVKLYRVTGEQKYLDMAQRFLEIRGVTYVPDGEGVMAPTYAQQHAPVAEQDKAVGHAVRATYLYSAMADVGALTAKPELQRALERIWANIVDTRMHITGGLGAVHGIEGFGPEYELPNADAFNETCAAVGNVMFNYRMFLLHGDAKYLDVAEVALLNNVLAAVNLDGNRFFYVNPLEADGKHPFNHGTPGRAPWFGTACCPSNLARLLPQVPGMAYAHNGDEVYATFYAASRTSLELSSGRLAIEQTTEYPNEGDIEFKLTPETPTRFCLLLRIPTWTSDRFVPGDLYHYADDCNDKITLLVNDEPYPVSVERGFAKVDRVWSRGDTVKLGLPMPVRVSECHSSVLANDQRIAFTRGPLVLCGEGVDNGGPVQRFFFKEPPRTTSATTSTATIASGSFLQVALPAETVTAEGGVDQATLNLTPYYAWNNRGVSSMCVWFPRTRDLAQFDPLALPDDSPFVEIAASHTFEEDALSAIADNHEPRWSSGNKSTRWSSRPRTGEPQWVEGRFANARRIRSVGVYWFDNNKDVKTPEEWSLEVKREGSWSPMDLYVTDEYGTRVNQYNVVHPAAGLTCEAIRVNMTPQQDASVGILEIDVVFEENDVVRSAKGDASEALAK
ncbi:Non-reducing end beta-L-arabinofuranosidase [Botrimarina hoheduenensis]|uniref:Non-reducing end beta-L-arabinofuranosidase n=2 Tax=Botrimarina hoheduenensis TaxID=2528000 RepID=A0A5C5VY48_9BACT|nr:Non-reducing end beta-L-arabinofuranosidase [Botrimarina hoheduenensis]